MILHGNDLYNFQLRTDAKVLQRNKTKIIEPADLPARCKEVETIVHNLKEEEHLALTMY